MMNDRLTKLEILFSEQGKMLEDLSAEMFQQQKDLATQQQRIEMLEEKLGEASASGDIAGHERPPHY